MQKKIKSNFTPQMPQIKSANGSGPGSIPGGGFGTDQADFVSSGKTTHGLARFDSGRWFKSLKWDIQ